MVGWHHQLNGNEFEKALWVGDGQGSLECCSPWGHKELDRTEQLNRTDPHLKCSIATLIMCYHVGKCTLRTVPSVQTVPLDRTAPAVLLVLVNKVLGFTTHFSVPVYFTYIPGCV